MIVPDSVMEWVVLHRTDVKTVDDYFKSLTDDFMDIEPHLPERVGSILDIGCGMAGIDILLKVKYPEAKLYLLDGDGPKDNFRGGYRKSMIPFNSRRVAESFLKDNGVTVDRWIDVGAEDVLEADLVVSLLSWGWHYPIRTYKVKSDCVILDSREKLGSVIKVIEYQGKHKGYRCLASMK